MNSKNYGALIIGFIIVVMGGLFLYMQYQENKEAKEFRDKQLELQQEEQENQQQINNEATEKECERIRSLCTSSSYHYKIIMGEIVDDGTCDNLAKCSR